MITWVFEENSFIPTAKLKNEQKFSILVDHLGTPTSMCNEAGESVWERSLDSCGRLKYGDHSSCPFMYQGQYYDKEIELAYNRFRYYDPEDGRYISVDPIGFDSGENNFYSYVNDPNGWVDILGLHKNQHLAGSNHPVTGVPFDSAGYPDFSANLYSGTGGKNDVEIELTGSRSKDFRAANKEAGFKKTPKGYTWHHHQNTGRMQLVDRKIHAKTGHAGGFSKHKKKAGYSKK